MLDWRNLRAAVLGIMRRAGASKFNGTKMLHSVKCVSVMAMRPLTLYQLAQTRSSGLSLADDFSVILLKTPNRKYKSNLLPVLCSTLVLFECVYIHTSV